MISFVIHKFGPVGLVVLGLIAIAAPPVMPFLILWVISWVIANRRTKSTRHADKKWDEALQLKARMRGFS